MSGKSLPATEGCCDGQNLPRLDVEERCLRHYLNFKYEGYLEVGIYPWMIWRNCSRMELLLVRMSLFLSAASPCWCFVNYRSGENTVHEAHRTGHSPSLKGPAPAQPGALVAFCVSPVSFPLCTGRGCHHILKQMLRFPLWHTKGQLPQPDGG